MAQVTRANSKLKFQTGDIPTQGDFEDLHDSVTWNTIDQSTQTASYTLVLADAFKLVTVSNASANNLTVPLNSSVAYDIGTQILVAQLGAGQTTIVATSGVTLNSSGSKLKLSAQYAMATLIKTGTDTWLVSGDLSA